MRRNLLLLTALAISFFAQAQNLYRESADSLYCAGLDAYNRTEYNTAVASFLQCDSLNKATDRQGDYYSSNAAAWAGCAYYKIGDEDRAKELTIHYRLIPVDQRLTVRSDSLSSVAQRYIEKEDWENALKYLQLCAEEEKQVLGEDHYYYANTLYSIGIIHFNIQHDYDAACVTWRTALLIYLVADPFHNQTIALLDALIQSSRIIENHDVALEWCRKKIKFQEKILGALSSECAESYSYLADYYAEIYDFASAIAASTQTLNIRKELFGEKHPEYATSLANLADYHSKLGDYQKAIEFAMQSLNIRKEIYGEKHPDYALSLSNLAVYHFGLGNYKQTGELLAQALNVFKEVYGEMHPHYASSLSNFASYHAKLGDYRKAIELNVQALNIYRKLYGDKHPDCALSLNNIAENYFKLGDYPKAIELHKEAMDIRRELYGEKHPDYAASLNNLAICLDKLGDYQTAAELVTQSLGICREIYGEKHPHCATLLDNQGNYYAKQGDYQRAEELMLQALDIRKELYGENHPDYATSLNNLANLYSTLGNYPKATALGMQTLNIFRAIYGEKHSDYATALANLASYYHKLGDFRKAIDLGRQALDIRKELLGENHSDYAASLNNLATYYAGLGDYEKMSEYGARSLKIYKAIYGEKHPHYAMVLANIANYYHEFGDSRKAIELGQQALDIRKELHGEEHPDYAGSLSNLANYHFRLGNHHEALELAVQSLNIRKSAYGEKHPHYAMSLRNLAGYHAELGNYHKSIELGLQALKIYRELLGEKHPDYATMLSDLARYYFAIDEQEQAAEYQAAYNDIVQDHILANFSNMTGTQRNMYWDTKQRLFCRIVKYNIAAPHSSKLGSASYNAWLLSKGILLSSEIEFDRLISQSGDTALLRKFENLRMTQLQLGFYYKKPIAERPSMEVEQLKKRAEVLEQDLIKGSKEYGDFTRRLAVKWQDVQAALDERSIAIEFAVDQTDSLKRYIALVVRKGWNVPKCVYIGTESDFDPYIRQGTALYNSKELSNKIWSQIIATGQIKDGDNLYFSPDGLFYQLAIEYLPTDDGRMMSEKYNIKRLSSTKELCFPDEKMAKSSAVLYGGLKYDLNKEVLAAESQKYKIATTGMTRGDEDVSRLLNFDTADSLTRGAIIYLPGTLAEVQDISETFNKKAIQYQKYTEEIGNEESFKALSGKAPGFLHIATHGFYLQPTEAEILSQYRKASFLMNDDDPQANVIDYSMSRTGLLFAGSQAAWLGKPIPESIDDGILTAKEISQLNLRGVSLAVLSACQTGLGEITSDGVAGLQRGFKKAGVKTLIMSLWKVDDGAARIMMARFYENLTSGESKREAFDNALSYLRNYEMQVAIEYDDYDKEKVLDDTTDGDEVYQKKIVYETRKIYANPRYWAAFIMLD